jgi:ABC-type transporter Mla subunit MlaD
VSKVELTYDEVSRKTRVKVKLFIEKGLEIRENYTFKIQGTHILSEPHIEITPQPGNFPLVKNGALIEGVTPVAVEALIEKADEISEKLSEILSGFQTAVQGEEGGNALKELVVNLASLSKSLDKALSGSEQDMKQTIANIHSSTESLSKILEHIESGEGSAGQLLMKDELYKEMREFVREIKLHPWKLLKKDKRCKFLGIF